MKQKNVLILALVAIVLVVAGVVASQKKGGEKTLADGGLLAPDLRAMIDKVDDIRVVTRNGDAVTQVVLQKKAGVWTVADRNYRADTKRLSDLFNALAQARRVEAKTSKPDNYGRLGVKDPASKGEGTGTLLRLLAADGKPQLELIFGSVAQGRHGQHVRVASDSQAWLMDQTVQLPASAAEWLDRSIVDIAPQDIVAVDFGTLTLKRSTPDSELELATIPAGRELSYAGVTGTAAASLSQLQAQDVLAAATIALPKPDATATFTSKANAAVSVGAHRQGEKNYLTLSASAADNTDDATRAQVQAWNDAWKPWVFEVDTFTYNKFVKSINDFTRETPKPAKAS